jgi:hypothetical protein
LPTSFPQQHPLSVQGHDESELMTTVWGIAIESGVISGWVINSESFVAVAGA